MRARFRVVALAGLAVFASACGAPAKANPFDHDGDGLDDRYELAWAKEYEPFLALDPADACPRGGMLVRVRPHPKNAALLFILYDHLYESDCGLAGHVGDDEAFGVTADPTKPGALGILAVRAISHQGTLCERDTTCGTLPGLAACSTAPDGTPVVFSSLNKHGSYASLDTCTNDSCFDVCTMPAVSPPLAIVDAGEPSHHLTDDLTTDGFITDANGWTEQSLFHFDPWKPGDFGGAGDVSLDLVDDAFVPPAPAPPK